MRPRTVALDQKLMTAAADVLAHYAALVVLAAR